MTATIDIDMTPLLKKYLQYEAISPEEPLRFHKQHFVNKFLKANLMNIEKLNTEKPDEKENTLQYYNSDKYRKKGTVSFAIPAFSGWKPYHKKLYIPAAQKKMFVKGLKAIYKYQFVLFYWQHAPKGFSKQKIANLWLEMLNIEDEILPKSQWRAIYREINVLKC